MDALVAAQQAGTSGHIEYFPQTFALRNKFKITFVRHALRGRKVRSGAAGGTCWESSSHTSSSSSSNGGGGDMEEKGAVVTTTRVGVGLKGPQHPEPVGGTFNYCCQGPNTADAENWYEGWRRSSSVSYDDSSSSSSKGGGGPAAVAVAGGSSAAGCAPPTLLHPVKGDACGRFSPKFGLGCWKREFSTAEEFIRDVYVPFEGKDAAAKASSSSVFKPFSARELGERHN